MSFLDKLVDSIDAYQRELWRDRHPFLVREPKGQGYQWVVKQKADGCRPVKAQANISMEKNPAPLPSDAQKSKQSGANSVADSSNQSAAKDQSGEAPPLTASAKKAEADCPQPPPFDMLDLPEGMKAMGFKYAAYCINKWFNGKAHVIEDEQKEQPTVVQPSEFVDTETFKLAWILGFGDVREKYENLLQAGDPSVAMNIYNQKARNELFRTFHHFMAQHNHSYSGDLDTLATCGNDKQMLHQRFQFQHIKVDMKDVLGGYTNAMNDLGASLANFAIYAAVANAKVLTAQYMRYGEKWWSCTKTTVEITHLYVYVKDIYSFNDKTNISQYLGHWNRQGIIIALDATVAEKSSQWLSPEYKYELGNESRAYLPPLPAHLDKPVDVKSGLRKADVFYPVRNRHFQRWRDIKKRGGDFVIFSDFKRISLPKTIRLELEEVCREYKR